MYCAQPCRARCPPGAEQPLFWPTPSASVSESAGSGVCRACGGSHSLSQAPGCAPAAASALKPPLAVCSAGRMSRKARVWLLVLRAASNPHPGTTPCMHSACQQPPLQPGTPTRLLHRGSKLQAWLAHWSPPCGDAGGTTRLLADTTRVPLHPPRHPHGPPAHRGPVSSSAPHRPDTPQAPAASPFPGLTLQQGLPASPSPSLNLLDDETMDGLEMPPEMPSHSPPPPSAAAATGQHGVKQGMAADPGAVPDDKPVRVCAPSAALPDVSCTPAGEFHPGQHLGCTCRHPLQSLLRPDESRHLFTSVSIARVGMMVTLLWVCRGVCSGPLSGSRPNEQPAAGRV